MIECFNKSRSHRLPYLMIIAIVSVGFLLIIPVSSAETLKVISNTDRCTYKHGIDKDYCKTVYELCDPALDMNKVDFKFKTMEDKSLMISIDDLSYFYSSKETKTNCREITIEGYKNPYKNVDNVLCYGTKCHEEHIWWNTSYLFKFCINGSTNAGEFNIPLLLNDSNITINGFSQTIWCNYTINTTSDIIGCFYFTNETFYQCVDRTETFAVGMDVDEGNATDTGNPWDFNTLLVAHLDNTTDSSIYENNLTAVNTPVRTDAMIGHGRDLEHDDADYYESSDINTYTSALTYMAWVNVESLVANGQIISKWPGAGGTQTFSLMAFNTGRFQAEVIRAATCGSIVTSDGFITTGIWYHVAVVAYSTTCTLFVDGVNITTVAGAGNINQNNKLLTIGAHPDNRFTESFDGIIDEVRLYNRSLSFDEIRAIYENQNGTFGITQPGPITNLTQENVSVKHFDLDVGNFLITSQQYQTLINDTFTLVNPLNLIIKGSGGAMKQDGSSATAFVSARLIFNGVTLYDQTIRSVRGAGDRGVFTFPITNTTGQGGINRLLLSMKRSGNEDINISNLGLHIDTTLSSNDVNISIGLDTSIVNYTSTTYLNIANFTINKTTNSTVLIDVDHRFESTSNNIIAECFFESEQTGEKTLTYSRWLQFSGNVGSSGINHRSQNEVNGSETWMLFCRSSSNNLILNNITVFIMNQQNDVGNDISGFQNSTAIAGLTGSGNVILSTDYGNIDGTQLELLTTIIMQSVSGTQDGSNSPIFRIRTNDSVCNISVERSLASNSDIGTAKVYLNCGNLTAGDINTYEVLADISVGETLDILNISMSSYETTPQLVIEGIVPPIVVIVNPINASTISENIDIEAVVTDFSRTGWRSVIDIMNSTGGFVLNILNEGTFENTTARTFNTRSLVNGNYTIVWTVFNNQGNNTDNISVIIANLIIPSPPTITFCLNGDLLLTRDSTSTETDGNITIEIINRVTFCHYGCSNVTLSSWGNPGCIESDYTLSLILIAVVLISVFSIRRIL